ncbi:hypothetical protein DFH06DRAFT_994499, partial [Mycena polygramma]
RLSTAHCTLTAWQGSNVDVNRTSTDTEFGDFIRENGGTVFYPVGVVNANLMVKGSSGLRIVDFRS